MYRRGTGRTSGMYWGASLACRLAHTVSPSVRAGGGSEPSGCGRCGAGGEPCAAGGPCAPCAGADRYSFSSRICRLRSASSRPRSANSRIAACLSSPPSSEGGRSSGDAAPGLAPPNAPNPSSPGNFPATPFCPALCCITDISFSC